MQPINDPCHTAVTTARELMAVFTLETDNPSKTDYPSWRIIRPSVKTGRCLFWTNYLSIFIRLKIRPGRRILKTDHPTRRMIRLEFTLGRINSSDFALKSLELERARWVLGTKTWRTPWTPYRILWNCNRAWIVTAPERKKPCSLSV